MPRHGGELSLTEQHDHELRRAVSTARLCDPTGADVLPPLSDAVVRGIKQGCLTISGTEKVH